MLSRLKGAGTDAGAGAGAAAKKAGEVLRGLGLFWSLLEPVFRSLAPPFCVFLLHLAVAGSVGVRGAGDRLSLR